MAEVARLGIDIGGTMIKAVGGRGARDRPGGILDLEAARRLEVPTPTTRGGLIDAVSGLIESLGGGEGPVGVASPGLAGRDNRSIHWMRGRLSAVEGLDWSAALGREAAVLNDAHAATLGEAWAGAAAGRSDVVMLTLGTGVGGGVICGGRLLQGATGRAGHLGHITLDLDGERDIVNTPGSLEDWVGNHTVAARTGFGSTSELVAAVGRGEPAAEAHWDRTLHALACGVGSLINAFDPEVVVLGGGIAQAGEAALFGPLAEKLAEVEWRPTGSGVPVVPAELGPWAGAVGAARFAETEFGV
ncbi:MAG: ROK family protein [Planctomycetota bacterium]